MSDPYKFSIKPAKCDLNGKKLDGQTIELKPYVDDYESKKFKKYANKIYFITLFDEVPCVIYDVSTLIPSDKEDEPLMKETLIFDKIVK